MESLLQVQTETKPTASARRPYMRCTCKGSFCLGSSPPEVDRIWLWGYYNEIPIYPILYLHKGDYRVMQGGGITVSECNAGIGLKNPPGQSASCFCPFRCSGVLYKISLNHAWFRSLALNEIHYIVPQSCIRNLKSLMFRMPSPKQTHSTVWILAQWFQDAAEYHAKAQNYLKSSYCVEFGSKFLRVRVLRALGGQYEQ